MNAAHSENLEFLKRIRGCFGSPRMWSSEYVFTGEAVIERRGERIKNQIRISDIVESSARLGSNQMVLKTNNSKMIIQIVPSLSEVITKLAAEFNANKTESERQHLEQEARQKVLRYKRLRLIGMILNVLITLAFGILIIWWCRKHY